MPGLCFNLYRREIHICACQSIALLHSSLTATKKLTKATKYSQVLLSMFADSLCHWNIALTFDKDSKYSLLGCREGKIRALGISELKKNKMGTGKQLWRPVGRKIGISSVSQSCHVLPAFLETLVVLSLSYLRQLWFDPARCWATSHCQAQQLAAIELRLVPDYLGEACESQSFCFSFLWQNCKILEFVLSPPIYHSTKQE